MKQFLLLVAAVVCLNGSVLAQSPPCAVDSLIQLYPDYKHKTNSFAAELAEFRSKPPIYHRFLPNGIEPVGPTIGCQDAVYIVPVVVHIDTSNGIVNVSDTQVYQQLLILNNVFAPHGIRFVLAKRKPDGSPFTGINRIGGSFDYRYDQLAFSYSASSSNYFSPERYFNLYVAPDILTGSGGPSGISGFSNSFADLNSNLPDLVVVRYTKFGNYDTCSSCDSLLSNSRGKVAVHEAGHYLGLRELWQKGCSGGNNSLTCATDGDLCCDTRPINANYSCPTPGGNDCSYHLPISDNHENYMDYSGENCLNNFTPDQVSLMFATLELYRSKLISPQNINQLDLSDCFSSAWFDAESNLSCDSPSFVLHAINYDNATQYRWIILLDTQLILDTTLNTNTLSWNFSPLPFGFYDVSLQITFDSTDIAVTSRLNYLQLADCSTPIASENANWYFGNYAGLRFTLNGGAIRDLEPSYRFPSNINTSEGTLSYSDSSGNLLFYGGGPLTNPGTFEVYNKNYLEMPNSPIIGDVSASQCGIILNAPNQANNYYIFTISSNDAGPFEGFRYSIIDLTLDSGLGDIISTQKNIPIKGPVQFEHSTYDSALMPSEQITAVPKCNGSDYWILVVNGFKTMPNSGTEILVYSLDSSGLNYVSQSNLSLIPNSLTKYTQGELCASPDGNWLFLLGNILRFNKANGNISLYRSVKIDYHDSTLLGEKMFAASFSPNSKLIYVGEIDTSDVNQKSNLFQFNLESSNDSLSRKLVTKFPYNYSFYQIQLGPDSKIYLNKPNQSSLAVINNPDLVITPKKTNACEYSINGPKLAENGIGGSCQIGLPNMRDALFPMQIPLDFALIDSNCGTVSFYPNTPCKNSYFWRFGDGDSSISEFPKHTYSNDGTYEILLIVDNQDTVRKDYKKGTDSYIAGDSIACTPAGSLAFYSISNPNPLSYYTWQIEGGTEGSLDPENNLGVNWDSTNGVLFLHQLNPANGCIFVDSMPVVFHTIDSNAIQLISAPCLIGSPFTIGGTTGIVDGSSFGMEYQWQKNDSMGWQDMISDTLKNYIGPIEKDTVWYRRKITNLNCQNYSDSIPVASSITINKDLTDYASCSYGPAYYNVSINLDSNGIDSIQLTLENYRQVFGSTWEWVEVDTSYYPNNFINEFTTGDSVRILIQAPGCDAGYSNSVKIQLFDLLTDKSNQIGCNNVFIEHDYGIMPENIDTFFVAQLNLSMQWIKEAPNCDSLFDWYYSKSDTNTFQIIPNSKNDTFFIHTSACNTGYYRVRFKGRYAHAGFGCYPTTSCEFIHLQSGSDLWSRDGTQDTGAEKNIDSTRDYWNSPDLWNCWQQTNCTTHESPEFMQSGTNQIFNTIRNPGPYRSDTFNVYLYWTLGGFYEKWPLSWHYDTIANGFYNPNYGQTFPMGSEIGIIGISGLDSAQNITIDTTWSPPNPQLYDTSSYYNAEKVKHPLCLLSRIVTCDAEPYGMTFPEEEATGENVINNNNIVTRNTEVSDSIGWNKKTPVYVLRMGNQFDDPKKIRVALENAISNFWDLGYFNIRMSSNLQNAWLAGGGQGNGYSLNGDVFTVSGDSFELNNIELEGNEWGWYYVQFKLDSLVSINSDRGQQLFRFLQYSSDIDFLDYQVDGGFNFLLNLYSPVISEYQTQIGHEDEISPDENTSGTRTLEWKQSEISKEENQPDAYGLETITTTFANVYPNPNSGLFHIQVNLQSERSIGIELYSAEGKRIMTIPTKKLAHGSHTIDLNGSHLAPGTYVARIIVNGEPKSCPVIIVR